MFLKQFERGRTFVAKLDYQADLLEELNKICQHEYIKAGYIQVIGAISSLKYGFFDQDEKEYTYNTYAYDESMEIVSCSGNVSVKDGKPFCHMHIVSSDKKGKCVGGHIVAGTSIYAAEVVIQEILGEDLVRELDETTKLTLWK